MPNPQTHPQIYQYLKRYQEDPSSRVFAPLAEAYRKAGLVGEAIEIAREGLKIHPTFVGGRVALARALFDNQRYLEVVDELTHVTRDVPDNLIAQRLLAESSLILGRPQDALQAYKMLLYFNPMDAEVAQIVRELEEQAYSQGGMVLRTDPASGTDMHVTSGGETLLLSPQERKIRKIEILQGLLQRVERYRLSIKWGRALGWLLAVLTVSGLKTPASQADLSPYRLGVALGSGMKDIVYRGVRLQREWNTLFKIGSVVEFTGYWELNAAAWHAPTTELVNIGFNPIFRFKFPSPIGRYSFIGGCIGFSFFNRSDWVGGGPDVAAFNFGDFGEIGIAFDTDGAVDVTFRWQHYSNASLWQPNFVVNASVLAVTLRI